MNEASKTDIGFNFPQWNPYVPFNIFAIIFVCPTNKFNIDSDITKYYVI